MDQNRREFLKASLGGSALMWLPPMVPGRLCGAIGVPTAHDDRVLVVVQLSGGNDGLNTLVPHGDDEYYRRRPTIALPVQQLHRIDAHLGFHPRMSEFKRLYDAQRLSVIQGVGYPNPDGDHEIAMRNWQSARPGEPSCQTGWLGRLADQVQGGQESDVPAAFVGKTRRPFTLNAEQAIVPSLASLQQWTLRGRPSHDDATSRREHLETPAGHARVDSDHALLDLVQRGTLEAHAKSRRVQEVLSSQPADVASGYPAFQLAQTFRSVAQLIRADLGIRVFCTELGGDGFGGFDNHANQLGNHCALLQQLSESVAAFVDELQNDQLADRVLLMTFSEFGRTIAENGRRGTDHGSAAPVFLAGGSLNGGLIGAHPDLTSSENGGQTFHTDFRRVYATVLDHWLGVGSQAVLDEAFEPLSLFRG